MERKTEIRRERELGSSPSFRRWNHWRAYELCIDLNNGTCAKKFHAVFARAEYNPLKPSVEAVIDSSRYFVVRVEDAGKKAYIGMGYVERSDSFDFNVAIQDYTKRAKAALNPPSPAVDKPSAPVGPKKDYTLKEGQTFSINIPGREKKPATAANLLGSDSGSSSSLMGGGVPLLPPPPSVTKRRS